VTISIQTWNCFGAAQSLRAFLRGRGAVDAHRFEHAAVASACDDVDVLCVQELWLEEAREFFERRPHPHKHKDSNRRTLAPLTFGGSGLGIASRLRVEHATTRHFRRPHVGPERFARKGMLHVRVYAPEHRVSIDVINTHLQSGYRPAAARVRTRQLAELRELVLSVGSEERAVVVCGDFNVDGHAQHTGDARALRAAMSDFVDLGAFESRSTFHPEANALARREGEGVPPQRLDYVFFRAPTRGRRVRADPACLTMGDPLVSRDGRTTFASDHAALRVELHVDPST
jgi:endonuclease/exonuclease/phosphatase family metal-dependent hydrolase